MPKPWADWVLTHISAPALKSRGLGNADFVLFLDTYYLLLLMDRFFLPALVSRLFSTSPLAARVPAQTTSTTHAGPTQIIPARDLDGWALHSVLYEKFKGRFRVEMDDEGWRIWADGLLTTVGLPSPMPSTLFCVFSLSSSSLFGSLG